MPTYEYVCEACDHRFDAFQSMSDSALRKCPECKKNRLRRVIGPGAAIIFRGSGFYQTDYRSESYKKAAEADRKQADGSKASGDGAAKSNGSAEKAGGKKAESAGKGSDG